MGFIKCQGLGDLDFTGEANVGCLERLTITRDQSVPKLPDPMWFCHSFATLSHGWSSDASKCAASPSARRRITL